MELCGKFAIAVLSMALSQDPEVEFGFNLENDELARGFICSSFGDAVENVVRNPHTQKPDLGKIDNLKNVIVSKADMACAVDDAQYAQAEDLAIQNDLAFGEKNQFGFKVSDVFEITAVSCQNKGAGGQSAFVDVGLVGMDGANLRLDVGVGGDAQAPVEVRVTEFKDLKM